MASDPLSFKRLIDIGIALSSEKDSDRLMERILLEAKAMGNADGGTLYIRTKDDQLQFTILRTDSLQYAQGGTSGQAISLPPVEMFIDGKPNLRTNVSFVANTGETINIGDAYVADKFDFTGTKKFDAATGYLSKSFLTVPLKNNAGRVSGVLQLLNSLDPETGEVVAFPEETQPLIEALASQAAVSLENRNLIESQKQLLDSFIELMASAVDAKSPYTGGHCQRVPVLDDRPDHIIEHDGIVHSANPDNPYGFKIEVPAHKYNRGEVYNLAVAKGTLTAEERFKINDHIVQTIVMLENLPFPKNLERVAEIAGGHHEKMDGTGYPKKLRGDEMSIPARVMAIADVFEALTAADRPYKPPKKLSESIRIMSVMVKDHHLDPDLFKLFLTSGVYNQYAEKYLELEQIDEVNIAQYL